MDIGFECDWRAPLSDTELCALVESHGGTAVPGWWDSIRPHSLGWVTARADDGSLVGFVNVAWDGGDHAFLLDTKTDGRFQRRGVGTAVVALAVEGARRAGCEWLHVDFRPELAPFYLEACGFRPTDAGLIRLHPRVPQADDRVRPQVERAGGARLGNAPADDERPTGPCPIGRS